MKIIIRTKNITLNAALKEYVEEKIGEVEKFINIQDEHKGKSTVEVIVDIGKETMHHHKGPFFKAEARLYLAGQNIVAQAESEDIMDAIVEVKDELQREVKKYKSKAGSKGKRNARIFKKLLHLSPLARLIKRKGGREREEGI